MENLKIDISRIETDLFALSRFGFNETDKGVYRPGFSNADMRARHWMMTRFEELGLEASMDGAANISGLYRGNLKGPRVMTGSHLDTVPAGGMFDGALGVVSALECVRVIKEAGVTLKHPIEVLGTSEEEGRFGGMLGAQALCGDLTVDALEKARDSEGTPLREAMAAQGMDPYQALHAFRRPESIKAFLEMHVEQGPVLEAAQKTVGVVEGISGVFKWEIRLIGKADHAGTAPMDMRADAFMGLVDFAHEIPRIIAEEGSELSRLTVGRVELKPGFPHTVPGESDFSLVGRDLSLKRMENLANACRRVLGAIARKHHLMFEYEQMSWLEPQDCDPALVDLVESKAKARGYSHLRLPSNAGHDSQFFARIAPTAMIFIPSVRGVSHAPDEWSQWADVEQGANVLLDCLLDQAT